MNCYNDRSFKLFIFYKLYNFSVRHARQKYTYKIYLCVVFLLFRTLTCAEISAISQRKRIQMLTYLTSQTKILVKKTVVDLWIIWIENNSAQSEAVMSDGRRITSTEDEPSIEFHFNYSVPKWCGKETLQSDISKFLASNYSKYSDFSPSELF